MLARILKITALLAVFTVIAGASAYLTLTFIVRSEETVIVPDLVGKDVVYVLEVLSDLGLNTKVKGTRYSSDIPKNHALMQEPEAGSEIKQGRDVRIIISKGPQHVLVPNLHRIAMRKARLILDENGLCQNMLSTAYHPQIPKGDVIAQTPRAGITVDRGTCVNLLVSRGLAPRAYKMPALIGRPLDTAVIQVEMNQLKLGLIDSRHQPDQPENIVLAQHPPAGHRATEGASVKLVINRRPGRQSPAYDTGRTGVGLLRHRAGAGFLRQRIRIRLNTLGESIDLFDEYVKPGQEIWRLIPRGVSATVLIFADNQLIETLTYD